MKNLVGMASVATLAGFSWFGWQGMHHPVADNLAQQATVELAKYDMEGISVEYHYLDALVSGAETRTQRRDVRDVLAKLHPMSRIKFAEEETISTPQAETTAAISARDAHRESMEVYSEALEEFAQRESPATGTDLSFESPQDIIHDDPNYQPGPVTSTPQQKSQAEIIAAVDSILEPNPTITSELPTSAISSLSSTQTGAETASSPEQATEEAEEEPNIPAAKATNLPSVAEIVSNTPEWTTLRADAPGKAAEPLRATERSLAQPTAADGPASIKKKPGDFLPPQRPGALTTQEEATAGAGSNDAIDFAPQNAITTDSSDRAISLESDGSGTTAVTEISNPEEDVPPENVTPAGTTLPAPVVEQSATEESTPEESTPEDSTPEDSTPEESTPEESTPEESAPEEPAPEEPAPEDPAPEDPDPEDPDPEDPDPEDPDPEDSAPADSTPEDRASNDATSADKAAAAAEIKAPTLAKQRARLGVYMMGVPGDNTVRIVDPGSAADLVGIKVGDRLVQIGMNRINAFEDLGRAISMRKPNDVIRIWLRRDGNLYVVDCRLQSDKKGKSTILPGDLIQSENKNQDE